MTPFKARRLLGLLSSILLCAIGLTQAALPLRPVSWVVVAGGGPTPGAAPSLEIDSLTIDDSDGDADGVLDPGESATIRVTLAPRRGERLSGASAEWVLGANSAPWTSLQAQRTNLGSAAASDEITLTLPLKLASTAPCGEPVDLSLLISTTAWQKSLPIELWVGGRFVAPRRSLGMTASGDDGTTTAATADMHGFAVVLAQGDTQHSGLRLERVSPDGASLGSTIVSPADAHHPRHPALVWNGVEYGLAWDDDRDGNREIYFARVTAAGNLIGSTLRISNTADDSLAPQLVWSASASSWVVAWSEAFGGEPSLRWALLDASGVKIGLDEELASGVSFLALLGRSVGTSFVVSAPTGPWQKIELDASGQEISRRALALEATTTAVAPVLASADSADDLALFFSRPDPAGRSLPVAAVLPSDSTRSLAQIVLGGYAPSTAILGAVWDRARYQLLSNDESRSVLRLAAVNAQFDLEQLPATVGPSSRPRDARLVAGHGRLLIVGVHDGEAWLRVAYGSSHCGTSDTSDRLKRQSGDGPEITCNGIDDDANPATLDAPDADGDTYDVCGPANIVNPDGKPADCNDTRADVNPGALEFCDGVDNDCDASTDEVIGTRYIAPTGNDLNNLCTNSGTPCKTFTHAIRAACVNATIFAAEGLYTENVVVDKKVIIDNSGLSQNTTLQGLGTDDVVKIYANGAIWDGVEVRGSAPTKACLRIGDAAHPNVRAVEVGNAAFYDCGVGIIVEETGNDPTFLGINRLTAVDCRDNDGNGTVNTGIGVLLKGLNGRFEIKTGNFRNNAGTGIKVEAPASGTNVTFEVVGASIEANGKISAGSGRNGIEVNGGSDVRIEGNDIFGHSGTAAGDDGRAVVLNGVQNGHVSCNRIRNNDTGVELKGGTQNIDVLHNRISAGAGRGVLIGSATGTNIKVNETLLIGNSVGVENAGTGTLNAKHNWWNSVNGPTGAGGSGDSVVGSVDSSNFIARAAEPVLVKRPIDSGWFFPLAACYDTLQGAIDANTAGKLLVVGAGQFFERVTMTKALDLDGVPGTAGGCSPAEIYGAQGSGANRPALRVSNVSGITISNLTIKSAGENTPACDVHSGDEIGLDFQNVSNSTVRDVCFRENGISEVRLYGNSNNNTLQRIDVDGQLCLPGQGCLCSHRSRDGVLIDGGPVCEGGTGAIPSGNKLLDSVIHKTTRGVSVRIASNTEIARSTIDAATTPSWDGGTYAACIQVAAADDTNIHDSTLGGDTETEGVRIQGKATGQCFTEELNADRTILRDNVVRTASGPGIYIKRAVTDPGTAVATSVRCNDLTQNGTGIVVDDAFAANPNTATLNDVHANSVGARNTGVDNLLAQRNWWGAANGPSGNGPGNGDSVLGSLDFSNWLASSGKNDADLDGFTECGGDCDDTKLAVRPGGTEVCNNADDDCDGSVDEGLPPVTYYRDLDADTYGGAGPTVQGCNGFLPSGYSAVNTDCNDNNPNINPGVAEIYCDAIDEKCNGSGDETPDADNDTYDVCGAGDVLNPDNRPADCNDLNVAAHPGAPELLCDGVDQACNGFVDEAPDGDGDGADVCGFGNPYNPDALPTDCDDNNTNRAPNLNEICDLVDNDCDVTVDEGFATSTYFRDSDGDGVGTSADTRAACTVPPGYVSTSGDCNDTNATVFPGAAELCADNLDNDCDTLTDQADTPCSGLLTANLRFQAGSKTTMTWNTAPSANEYAVYRGSIDAKGMRGNYDHRNLASELSGATAQDTQVPAPSQAFYYLATGLQKNGTTGDITGGPLGRRSNNASRLDATSVTAGPRIYVNPDAVGAGTGLSWADAYTSLSNGLRHNKAPSRGLEIWVKGTLNNNGGNLLNGATRPGVQILGGFAGTETGNWQRNPTTNVTTWKGSAALSLLQATGASVVIDGLTLDTGVDGIVVTGNGKTLEWTGVTAKNFTGKAASLVTNGSSGGTLRIQQSSVDSAGQFAIFAQSQAGTINGTIRASSFSGGSDTVIKLEADPQSADATVTTALLRNTISGGNRGIWLSAKADNDGFRATVSPDVVSNLVHHVTTESLRVEATGSFSTLTAATAAKAIPNLVNNSLVDGATGLLCTVTRSDSSSNVAGHEVRASPKVFDNLITHMTAAAIRESSDAIATNLVADPVCVGNDLFSATPLYRDEGTTDFNISQVNGIAGNSANYSSDPLYVNRASRDYHLSATSPALNRGSLNPPATAAEDIDGELRTKGSATDTGADER